jgi:putative transcriptional regulator
MSDGGLDRLDNTLKTHRDRLGLSQQALADLVGVSRQAVISIEAGRQVPSTSLGLRLARALRCGVEDLFKL